eukprot:1630347-Amphidinium_carterae.1
MQCSLGMDIHCQVVGIEFIRPMATRVGNACQKKNNNKKKKNEKTKKKKKKTAPMIELESPVYAFGYLLVPLTSRDFLIM